MRALRDDHLEVPLVRRYSAKQRGFDEGMARHAAVALRNAVLEDDAKRKRELSITLDDLPDHEELTRA